MRTEIKINFQLQPDADGYPPVSVESLWAKASSEGYIIDSIPFFTNNATLGDRVRVHKDKEGELWFEHVEIESQNSLIRVIFFDASYTDAVVTELSALGCGVERMQEFKLLAVDVPVGVDLLKIQKFLQARASVGQLDYEEPILRQ